MAYRDTMVALALSYRGVGMAPATRAQYLDLIAAGEHPEIASQMGRMSGCALAIRGYLRLDGFDDPRVRAPYKVGMAIAWLIQMARERRALVAPPPHVSQRDLEALGMPQPGDVILVGGQGAGNGGSEHVYVVTRADPDRALESVDGGQVDGAGLQVIRERFRRWHLHRGGLWDTPLDGSAKRVQAWIDLDRLRSPAGG